MKLSIEERDARQKTSSRQFLLRFRYGLTIEQYEEMLDAQDRKCKICGDPLRPHKAKTHVDHCHKTGKVRGILCGNCNRGIGMFRDDIKILASAIRYLKEREPLTYFVVDVNTGMKSVIIKAIEEMVRKQEMKERDGEK